MNSKQLSEKSQNTGLFDSKRSSPVSSNSLPLYNETIAQLTLTQNMHIYLAVLDTDVGILNDSVKNSLPVDIKIPIFLSQDDAAAYVNSLLENTKQSKNVYQSIFDFPMFGYLLIEYVINNNIPTNQSDTNIFITGKDMIDINFVKVTLMITENNEEGYNRMTLFKKIGRLDEQNINNN